jgi:hypothetical protein
MGAVASLVGLNEVGKGGLAPIWMWFFLGGAVLGLLGPLLVVAAIRCPSCGARLFWQALSEKPFPASISWFVSLQACPACGCDGAD